MRVTHVWFPDASDCTALCDICRMWPASQVAGLALCGLSSMCSGFGKLHSAHLPIDSCIDATVLWVVEQRSLFARAILPGLWCIDSVRHRWRAENMIQQLWAFGGRLQRQLMRILLSMILPCLESDVSDMERLAECVLPVVWEDGSLILEDAETVISPDFRAICLSVVALRSQAPSKFIWRIGKLEKIWVMDEVLASQAGSHCVGERNLAVYALCRRELRVLSVPCRLQHKVVSMLGEGSDMARAIATQYAAVVAAVAPRWFLNAPLLAAMLIQLLDDRAEKKVLCCVLEAVCWLSRDVEVRELLVSGCRATATCHSQNEELALPCENYGSDVFTAALSRIPYLLAHDSRDVRWRAAAAICILSESRAVVEDVFLPSLALLRLLKVVQQPGDDAVLCAEAAAACVMLQRWQAQAVCGDIEDPDIGTAGGGMPEAVERARCYFRQFGLQPPRLLDALRAGGLSRWSLWEVGPESPWRYHMNNYAMQDHCAERWQLWLDATPAPPNEYSGDARRVTLCPECKVALHLTCMAQHVVLCFIGRE